MSAVQEILQRELTRINLEEKRDDKLIFDPRFVFEKKGLYAIMLGMFILTLGLLIYSDIFSRLDVWICVAIFVLLNGFFFFHITPSYHLDDIDKIAWKNCYTGEWYREVPVRSAVIDQILNSDQVSDQSKNEIHRLQALGAEIFFRDLAKMH
ncbi:MULTISPECIES: YlaC family protein [Rosenbergiella]|uniref:Inner membrane protein YlaC n=1 Tax=Rosenbergiella nectarea TaxID=988801 RepID=A0A1H9KCW7_9GAMM|nr:MULTISPECIES: YlaC family protein [Rosenbergiella]MBT0721797.1 hypothetical protein [Rosenbergiella collisarenosi]MBT0730181.1 hypothetical protein [Rosenbergiella nectarea subsp. apis]SEQ96735.1 Inner membrane protein YlaC [Rosenbergiella nectarea]